MATKTIDDSSDLVYSETVETFSSWRNDCKDTFTFKLLTDEKAPGDKLPGINNRGNLTTREEMGRCKRSLFLKVVIKPGQTISLPAKYDQAIRWVSPRTNEVVGGLCPLLVKIGEDNVVVNKAFDYNTAILHETALSTMKALEKEDELRNALNMLERSKETTKTKK